MPGACAAALRGKRIPRAGASNDWTLLVQDMDKWDADVRALLDRFRFLPAWRIDDVMISFAVHRRLGRCARGPVRRVPAAGAGTPALADRRRPARAARLPPDVELKLLQRFKPSHDWVLEPGDMLYLPPGVPHHGEALEPCMTFSIGMRAPSRAELLVDLAEELAALLPEESRYADPDLVEPRDAFEIDDAAFARVDQACRRWRAWTRSRAGAGSAASSPATAPPARSRRRRRPRASRPH
jgi:50S ribosomal protein L16 3-hydroxylase